MSSPAPSPRVKFAALALLLACALSVVAQTVIIFNAEDQPRNHPAMLVDHKSPETAPQIVSVPPGDAPSFSPLPEEATAPVPSDPDSTRYNQLSRQMEEAADNLIASVEELSETSDSSSSESVGGVDDNESAGSAAPAHRKFAAFGGGGGGGFGGGAGGFAYGKPTASTTPGSNNGTPSNSSPSENPAPSSSDDSVSTPPSNEPVIIPEPGKNDEFPGLTFLPPGSGKGDEVIVPDGNYSLTNPGTVDGDKTGLKNDDVNLPRNDTDAPKGDPVKVPDSGSMLLLVLSAVGSLAAVRGIRRE